MNNSCKISAGRCPESFFEITVSSPRQTKISVYDAASLPFRAPALLCRETAGNPSMTAKSRSREKTSQTEARSQIL